MARSAETKLMELRAQAPDLAETVTEKRMTVNEVYAAFEARKREIQDVIDFAKQYIVRDINTFATKVSTIVRALKHTNELVPDREVVDQVFEAAERPMGNPETIRAWEDDLYDQATEKLPRSRDEQTVVEAVAALLSPIAAKVCSPLRSI